MPLHIGIVGCSAEGAALCYRTICQEGSHLLGAHAHPEVTMHTFPLAEYLKRKQTCLLCDYVELERSSGERVVCENQHFVAFVPFWAVWPFELLVCSKGHVADLCALDDAGRNGLADMLKRITTRYDNLFETSFPYTMGFHQQPTDGDPHPEWHLHAHYCPPLLRSATVRKFMVGYELLDAPQRDITPEAAAERLRSLPEQHYRNGKIKAGD